MAKTLSIDSMLEAAHDLRLKDLPRYINILEAAAHSLALAIAEHTGATVGATTWEGQDMGGLCASFYAPDKETKCPKAIHRGDPGGDWKINNTLNQPPTRSFEVQHEFDFEPTYVCPLDEGQGRSWDADRMVQLSKGLPWEDRRVLADVIAEFLSRTENSR
jgi:hypothetical protein